jgi:glutaredoxin
VKTSRRSLLGLVVMVLGISAASRWWTGRREDALGRQLAAAARPGDLRMLSSDSCAICVAARRWFVAHGVPFSECSIERDADCRARFDALGAPGTPVILVRGQPQLGFSPARLLERLQAG